jgi:hypothetical protein
VVRELENGQEEPKRIQAYAFSEAVERDKNLIACNSKNKITYIT